MNDPLSGTTPYWSQVQEAAAHAAADLDVGNHHGLRSRLSSQASFHDFYRQIAEFELDSPSNSPANYPWANRVLPSSATGQGGAIFATFATDTVARRGAVSEDFSRQLGAGPLHPLGADSFGLDGLRRDLEQSYQNTEYELVRARDLSLQESMGPARDRSAEMLERQRREQELRDSRAVQAKQAKRREIEVAQKNLAEDVRAQTAIHKLAQERAKEREQVIDGDSTTRADTRREPGSRGAAKKELHAEGENQEKQLAEQKLQQGSESLEAKGRGDLETLSASAVELADLEAKPRSAGQAKAGLNSAVNKQSVAGKYLASNAKSLGTDGPTRDGKGGVALGPKASVDAQELNAAGRGDESGGQSKLRLQVVDERSEVSRRMPSEQRTKSDLAGSAENGARTTDEDLQSVPSRSQANSRQGAESGNEERTKLQMPRELGMARSSEQAVRQVLSQAKEIQDKNQEKNKGAASAELEQLEIAEAPKLGERPVVRVSAIREGRVAQLRRERNEGMQYRDGSKSPVAAASPKFQAQSQGKAALGLGRVSLGSDHPSAAFDGAAGHLATGHGPAASGSGLGNSTPGVILRSWAQQIAENLREGPLAQSVRQLQFRLLDQNRGEIRLRLNPENLGQVHIRVNIDGNQLSGHIVADSAEAARILQDNMQQLEARLRDGGFDNQGLNVSVGGGRSEDAQSQAQAQAQDHGPSGGGRNRVATGGDDDWEDIGRAGESVMREQSQINYRV